MIINDKKFSTHLYQRINDGATYVGILEDDMQKAFLNSKIAQIIEQVLDNSPELFHAGAVEFDAVYQGSSYHVSLEVDDCTEYFPSFNETTLDIQKISYERDTRTLKFAGDYQIHLSDAVRRALAGKREAKYITSVDLLQSALEIKLNSIRANHKNIKKRTVKEYYCKTDSGKVLSFPVLFDPEYAFPSLLTAFYINRSDLAETRNLKSPEKIDRFIRELKTIDCD